MYEMANSGKLFDDELTEWLLESGFIKSKLQMFIHYKVPAWAKGLIRYFSIFYDQVLDSNLHFRKPEKMSEGEDTRVQVHAR